MSRGLYSLAVMAEWLGKKPDQVELMVEEDGLPAIPVTGRKRDVLRFALRGVHKWLRKISRNEPLTLDELQEELDDAALVLSRRVAAKKERRALRQAQGHGTPLEVAA